jgi:hypothetical protein
MFELYISLINAIKGEIEGIRSLKSHLRTKLKKFKTKDYFVRCVEIQESTCKILDVKLKRLSKIRIILGLIVRFQEFRRQIKN